MFDDGSGNVEVWRIENFELVLQPKELYGTFFGGDSYVILYTYQKNNKSCFVVYYWLVSELQFTLMLRSSLSWYCISFTLFIFFCLH